MRILLIAPLFPPDKGVSAFRMKFFFDELSRDYQVDVLKPGDTTNLEGTVKTMDRSLFGGFASSLMHRHRIAELAGPVVAEYDLVIASATPFGLFEFARAAARTGKKYILDLRDLPDLTTSEQKNKKWQAWLKFKAWLIDKYIEQLAVNAEALLCVGTIATALTQQKYRSLSTEIVNVHNGFSFVDLKLVQESTPRIARNSRDRLIVGCVGNIFNFRDTHELRDVLSALNGLGVEVIIRHWGKIGPALQSYLKALKNIDYVPCEPVVREVLLEKLHDMDCFLLPCSDDLIWEPTTSVFDYILFRKPILFVGLKNNEAYSILEAVGARIVRLNDMTLEALYAQPEGSREAEVLLRYSREFHFQRLLRVVKKAETASLINQTNKVLP